MHLSQWIFENVFPSLVFNIEAEIWGNTTIFRCNYLYSLSFTLYSFTNDILLQNECNTINLVIVTYTTTVYAAMEDTLASLVWPLKVLITIRALWLTAPLPIEPIVLMLTLQNSYPILAQYEWRFNRTRVIEHAHCSYD